MADQQSGLSLDEIAARAKIGRWLVAGGLLVIVVLGSFAIYVAIESTEGAEKKFGYVKDIISIFLPVVAAWVGTVLAFYFAKENFVAAAEQTANLVGQLTSDKKLQAIPVSDAMIPVDRAAKLVTDRLDSEIKLKAEIVDGFFGKNELNRLPIVNSTFVVRYVLHRSMFDKFIASKALEKPQSAGLDDLTLDVMLKDDDYKRIALAFGTVKRDAHLAAAKTLMDGNSDCSDVFVTQDGTKGGPMLGWITNVIVSEKSKL